MTCICVYGSVIADATANTSGKSKTEVDNKLQNEGHSVKDWGIETKINVHFMIKRHGIFGIRYKTQNLDPMSIHIDGNKTKSVSEQKLLGVNKDENLLWTDHIDYLCSPI